MPHIFQTFKQASVFAADYCRQHRATARLERRGDSWEVIPYTDRGSTSAWQQRQQQHQQQHNDWLLRQEERKERQRQEAAFREETERLVWVKRREIEESRERPQPPPPIIHVAMGGPGEACHQCGGDGGAGGRCPRCGGNGFEPHETEIGA